MVSTSQIRFLSIIYIIFPNIIFVLGWLNFVVAISVFTSMIFALFFSEKSNAKINNHHTNFINKDTILLLFIWALGCSFISGAGGFCLQVFDYDKHDIIFNNLAIKDWPVLYNPKEFLCYYLAYYLPAGLWGKIFGIKSLNYFILIWNAIGLLFLFLQIVIYFNVKHKVISIIFLTLFLPLAFPGRTLLNIDLSTRYISFLNDFLSFLYFAPQRIIGTGIILFYLLFEFEHLKSNKNLFVLTLGLMWNPMAVLIFILLTLFYLFKNNFNQLFSIQNFLMLPFWGSIIAYFLAHFPVNEISFYFSYQQFKDIIIEYSYFILVECHMLLFLILLILLRYFNIGKDLFESAYLRPAILSLLIMILIIPIRFGFFNDLTWSTYGNLMIFINMLIIIIGFSLFNHSHLISRVFSVLFLLNCIVPNIICQLKVIKYNYSYEESADKYFGHIYHEKISIDDLGKIKSLSTLREGIFYHQYVGSTNSFFYKYLANH